MIKTAMQVAMAKFPMQVPAVEEVNNNTLLSSKEVAMSKVKAIVVKVSPVKVNPSKEVVVKQEPNYKAMYQQALEKIQSLSQEVRAMQIRLEPKEVTEGKKIMQGGLAPKKHQEVKKQVIRISAQTAEPKVEEVVVKAKPDMHEAGFKAIETRMVNYVHKRPQEVKVAFVGAKVGEVRKVLVDKGLPTEKMLKMRLDKVEGRYHGFTLKVETKAGPRYPKLAFQF